MKKLVLLLAMAPAMASADIVATNPIAEVGIPTDIQTFPVNGFYGTTLKFRVKLTTRSNGPKPGQTYVEVDGKYMCGDVAWAPTGSGNWTAWCEKDVASTAYEVGTSTIRYKVSKTTWQGTPHKDGYVGGSATATLTVAKVPVTFDLEAQPMGSAIDKRSFQIDMQAKLGLDLVGRTLHVTANGKPVGDAKSGAGTISVTVVPNTNLSLQVSYDGDANTLPASQTWSIPVSDPKPCALKLSVSSKKTGWAVGELTANVTLASKYAFPVLGMPGKTIKVMGWGANVTLMQLTTDAQGKATGTVTLKEGMANWLHWPIYAAFAGEPNAPACSSGGFIPLSL